jgi:hypothetical protein
MKSLVSPFFLALTLAASGALAADDMYRSTMPDGSVRYGEKPEFGAKSVKKVPPPPPATGVTVVTPEEKGRRIAAPQEGGTAVLPTPQRSPAPPAASGQLYAPSTLPQRNTGY